MTDTQNDTSELLERYLPTGEEIFPELKDELGHELEALIARREQAAELRGRIDELDKTIEIWIHNRSEEEYANYLERRKATLQATKPEKG